MSTPDMTPDAAIALLRAHCCRVETPEYIVQAFNVLHEHVKVLEQTFAFHDQAREAVANRPANAVLGVDRDAADDKAHAIFITRSKP